MNILSILLETKPAEGAGIWGNVLLFGGMAVIMYFFMIRPQMKRQKEAKNFRESLSKGDKVVTIGGVHGTILEISETNVLIKAEDCKLRIEKSALSSTNQASEQEIAQKQR